MYDHTVGARTSFIRFAETEKARPGHLTLTEGVLQNLVAFLHRTVKKRQVMEALNSMVYVCPYFA